MLEVRVRHPVAPADRATVAALADAAEAFDGHPSLGDSVWRDLDAPGEATVLVIADAPDGPVGVLHLTAGGDGVATAAVVVHPNHRHHGVASALVDRAVELLASKGRWHLVLWAFAVDEQADAFARAAQLRRERELWQMRVELPLAESPRWPPGTIVRPFEPGRDDADWLAVNNRSFAHDPDQGGWTAADLRAREREAWFDPQGFLLALDDDGLAGFCWTKVHPPAPPHEPQVLGEIYVIGVDPARQGRGLGRALVIAGLQALHARGAPVGMLFVDATNGPAVRLYRDLGFSVARVDRAYGRDVP